MSLTVLAIASYNKGHEFMRQCKREGCRVLLLTSQSLEHAEWPRESLDGIYFIPDEDKVWNMKDVILGVSWMSRTEVIDRIVALDDYDVEKAAELREHLRIEGMGDSTARFFRDKLAMRTRAMEAGINVPAFVHVLNRERLHDFMQRVPPPWVLKPRLEAGAIGIRKLYNQDDCWREIDGLGEKDSFYLLEHFVPGDVFHVDSIVYDYEVVFSVASQYQFPPIEVSQEGRVFSTRTLLRGTETEAQIFSMNRHLLKSLGLKLGVSHSEYIRRSDGEFVFLETSSRPGGAHIVELVEAASGLNLWAEMAKVEIWERYSVPEHRQDYAALLISLARQEWPDMSSYADPEVVWKLNKKNHAGLIVRSDSHECIEELLGAYTQRFITDFFAKEPPRSKPVD